MQRALLLWTRREMLLVWCHRVDFMTSSCERLLDFLARRTCTGLEENHFGGTLDLENAVHVGRDYIK